MTFTEKSFDERKENLINSQPREKIEYNYKKVDFGRVKYDFENIFAKQINKKGSYTEEFLKQSGKGNTYKDIILGLKPLSAKFLIDWYAYSLENLFVSQSDQNSRDIYIDFQKEEFLFKGREEGRKVLFPYEYKKMF